MEYPVKTSIFKTRHGLVANTSMALLFWSYSQNEWIATLPNKTTPTPGRKTWTRRLLTPGPLAAIVSTEGQVLFSKGRHDFRTSRDNSYAVDGGPGFERVIGNKLESLETVILLPQRGELNIIDRAAAALMRDPNETW